MKSFITLIIITFCISFSYAQKPRKKKSDYSDTFSEIYYVLKEDKSVKDGPYELRLLKIPVITGQYENSVKIGVWTYYNSLGKPLYKYDFSSNTIVEWYNGKFDAIQWEHNVFKKSWLTKEGKVVPYTDYSTREFEVIRNSDTITTTLERPPIMIGSDLMFQFELFKILQNNISNLPNISFSSISFIVDKDGNARDFNIEATSGAGFEKGFISEINQRNLKWIPGQIDAKPVMTKITIPIIIKTSYRDNENVTIGIIFTNAEFMNYYKTLERDREYGRIGWDFKLYE